MSFDLGKIGDWFTDANNLKAAATVGMVAGGLYNDYRGNKIANEQNKLNKRLINLQEQDYKRGVEREDAMDMSMNTAFSNSDLNRRKDQPLIAL